MYREILTKNHCEAATIVDSATRLVALIDMYPVVAMRMALNHLTASWGSTSDQTPLEKAILETLRAAIQEEEKQCQDSQQD